MSNSTILSPIELRDFVKNNKFNSIMLDSRNSRKKEALSSPATYCLYFDTMVVNLNPCSVVLRDSGSDSAFFISSISGVETSSHVLGTKIDIYCNYFSKKGNVKNERYTLICNEND